MTYATNHAWRVSAHGNRCPAIGWLLVVLASFAILAQPASSAVISESSQLPIYFKLLTYDRTLWQGRPTKLTIGLLHRLDNHESSANHAAMTKILEASADKTINGVRFDFTTIRWTDRDDLVRQMTSADIDVLYVTDGHVDHLDAVASGARSKGIRTLSGCSCYVALGVSLGLDLEGDRPLIMVNLEAMAAEGHQLDARVLRLCKVVKR